MIHKQHIQDIKKKIIASKSYQIGSKRIIDKFKAGHSVNLVAEYQGLVEIMNEDEGLKLSALQKVLLRDALSNSMLKALNS